MGRRRRDRELERALGMRVVDSGLWVSLHDGLPTSDDAHELTALGYVRVPLVGYRLAGTTFFWVTLQPPGALTIVANAYPVEFPPALEDWTMIMYAGLWNDPQRGRLLQDVKLGAPVTVRATERLSFDAGMLEISFIPASDNSPRPNRDRLLLPAPPS